VVAQNSSEKRRSPLASHDALAAVLLFAGLAVVFALTRSHWLDDWDSVNFALGLDDFDVPRHQPHPPGYPIYIALGKLAYLAIPDHAAALTLVSTLSGAAVAAMFYLLCRRDTGLRPALCATLIMALSPLFWLQSGLALTDMFGMVFVLGFLLTEAWAPPTPRGQLIRRLACGAIAGLALGARPHFSVLIFVYWGIRGLSSPSADSGALRAQQALTAGVTVLVGAAAWIIPAAIATGGAATYLHATIGQFEWRYGRSGVSVLGSSMSAEYLLSRATLLIGSIGQAFAPMHLTASNVGRRAATGLLIVAVYLFLAWRSPSKDVARPYILASAAYLLMLFILLPTRHLRYFLPFSLIVGWAVTGYLGQFRRPLVRAAALVPIIAVVVLPSFFLIGDLGKVPPPVAALKWVKTNRPEAILYSDQLRRHAAFYWRDGESRAEPKDAAGCDAVRRNIAADRPVLSTTPSLCGLTGVQVARFKRDARINDKHSRVTIFEFGSGAPGQG
jgi:4-amino-4-deoxy-L-arabinose transferase-like glycosyltransferase